MGSQSHSNLWSGFEEYEVHRGTLVANVVTTITFVGTCVSVEVEHIGNVTNDIFFTLGGGGGAAADAPTVAGTSDTNNRMVRLEDSKTKALDKRCSTVKLISAGAVAFQVIGLK